MAKVKKKSSKKKGSSAEPANSRELLLQAAKKCFGAEGFDRTSTRDIAAEAGVNISLISYHFQGKDGLLRAVLEEMSAAGIESAERILKKPTSIEDFKTRLQIFMEEFLRAHMKHSESSCILMRETMTSTPNPNIIEMFKSRFVIVFNSLVEFLTYAQKQKFISPDMQAEICAMTIMGCIKQVLTADPLRKAILGAPGLLDQGIEKTTAQLANQLLNGLLPR